MTEERMIDDFEDEIENNMEYNIEAFYGGSYTGYEDDPDIESEDDEN